MIFVNGIQRSGTNFATTVYNNSINWCYPYWKHDPKLEGIDPECDQVFCIIKNPYSWVESICFRNKVDIVQWFPSRHLVDKENHLGPYKINLKRLLDTYYIFYTSWMNYEKTKLIQYEDLLKNNDITKVPMSDSWDPAAKRQYLKYETPLIPLKSIKFISEYLGEDFFHRIGYPIK